MSRLLALLLLCAACSGKDEVTDADGDGFDPSLDCDDADPEISPVADERCDGLDNDCDGEVDDYPVDRGLYYLDQDGDSYGSLTDEAFACTQPEGYAPAGGDCDDADDGVFPGASESCDGKDDDCDGLADEADPDLDASTASTWYRDLDADGYGDADAEGEVHCQDPSTGYEAYVADNSDCDDGDGAVSPAADEVCDDGQDTNCDGEDGDCGVWGALDEAGADARIYGLAEGDAAGSDVASADDQNADGLLDVWISGAMGVVYGVQMPVTGRISLSEADTTLSGFAAPAGAPISGGRDLDGDGVCDLLVGAPDEGLGGAARLFLGPLRGAFSDDAADLVWSGAEKLSAGADVALSQDLSGDGLVDVVVTLPGLPGVAVVSDPAATDLGVAALLTSSSGDLVVARAGDVNADGVADLLVGDPGAGEGGEAWVVWGPVSASAALADTASGYVGMYAGDGLGTSVASAGDPNDDGYADVLLGAPGWEGADDGGEPLYDAGQAYLLAGGASLAADLSGAAASLSGAGVHAGGSLAGVGDTDGDGNSDVAVGAPDGAGGLVVYLGPLDGAVGTAGAALVLSGSEGDLLGSAVAGIGDADGDGLSDLLVGAPGDSTNGAGAGEALLIYGVGD